MAEKEERPSFEKVAEQMGHFLDKFKDDPLHHALMKDVLELLIKLDKHVEGPGDKCEQCHVAVVLMAGISTALIGAATKYNALKPSILQMAQEHATEMLGLLKVGEIVEKISAGDIKVTDVRVESMARLMKEMMGTHGLLSQMDWEGLESKECPDCGKSHPSAEDVADFLRRGGRPKGGVTH